MKNRLQFIGGEVSYAHLNRIQHEINRNMLPPFMKPLQGARLKSIWYDSPRLMTLYFHGGFQMRLARLDPVAETNIGKQRREDQPMIGRAVEAIWFFAFGDFVIEFEGGGRMVVGLTA